MRNILPAVGAQGNKILSQSAGKEVTILRQDLQNTYSHPEITQIRLYFKEAVDHKDYVLQGWSL